MVRSFYKRSEREQAQTHASLTGGMRSADRELILRSAAARSDFWSTQREKGRDAVSLISARKNATHYIPERSARRDRYMLERAISLFLELVQQDTSSQAAAPARPDSERVVVDLTLYLQAR